MFLDTNRRVKYFQFGTFKLNYYIYIFFKYENLRKANIFDKFFQE